MKDFIIGLILTVILIVVFSVFGPKEGTMPPLTGFGTTYKSDTGMVIPGSGSEPLKVYAPEEMQTPEETEPEETTPSTEQPVEESCAGCETHNDANEEGETEMAEYIDVVLILLVLSLILRLRTNAILRKIEEMEYEK